MKTGPAPTDRPITVAYGHVSERGWNTVTARIGDEAVGELELDCTDEGEWQVVSLLVDDGVRRNGIGTGLFAYAVDQVTDGKPIHHAGPRMSPDAQRLYDHLAAVAPDAHRFAAGWAEPGR